MIMRADEGVDRIRYLKVMAFQCSKADISHPTKSIYAEVIEIFLIDYILWLSQNL